MRRWRAAGVVVGSAAAFLAAANAASCGLDVVGNGPSPEASPEDTFRPEASLPESGPTPDATVPDAPVDAGPSCPTGKGPAMVRVAVGAASYCIDSTEVTNAQYDDFFYVGTGGGRVDGGIEAGLSCFGVTAFTRRNDAAAPDLPVEGVAWCDAFAYCAWAGRHLCRAFDGGFDAGETEWSLACTGGGSNPYPYGDAYAPVCNDSTTVGAPVAVGSRPGCEGGVRGLFDMSGNVAEYVEACSNATTCDYVGGFYNSPAPGLTCRSRGQQATTAPTPGIGFRCCAPVKP